MLFWRVWYIRNELVHAKPAQHVDVSVSFLSSYLDTLSSVRLNPNVDFINSKMVVNHCFPQLQPACVSREAENTCWQPPSQGRVKLNTDGSVLNGVAGTGIVLCDHWGNMIFYSRRHFEDCEDALESEVLAIQEGINLAL